MSDSVNQPIQLFHPTYRVDEALAEIRQCLESGWTGLGGKTVEFEQAWCAYTGLPHAHMTNSATAGLHLALHALRTFGAWKDGEEIITTPLTFVSTAHVIMYERLMPVFVDVDEYLCLDATAVETALTPRTRAVIFVGHGGNTGQLPAIIRLCRERGLKLILDAAHMAGTRLCGQHVGAEADAAVFSFHAVKNLPTADAGMVCMASEDADALVRRRSWLGITRDTYSRNTERTGYQWRYDVEAVGWKYHGNAIMAALGLVGLRHLDEDNARRRELAAQYDAALAEVPNVARIMVAPNCESSRHLYQVMVPHRDAVMAKLNEAGIFPGVHYQLLTTFAPYRAIKLAPLPWAEYVAEHLLSLPLHLRMEGRDVARVATVLKEAVA